MSVRKNKVIQVLIVFFRVTVLGSGKKIKMIEKQYLLARDGLRIIV
jgi:hypothetical protein